MAYIKKRKHKFSTTYLATVKRRGFGIYNKSFASISEAKKWARTMESKFDKGDTSDYSMASKITLGELFKRYIKEGKHLKKKQAKNEVYRCDALLKDELSSVNLLFNKDFNFISVVIQTALQDWELYLPSNPCKIFKREPEGKPRERVLSKDEQKKLIEECAFSNDIYLKPAVKFSLETSIRQGELLKINYKHINWNKRTLTLFDTKNGEDRTIPLSPEAFLILSSLPRQFDGRLFPRTRDQLNRSFYNRRKKLSFKDFRWHDLRRTSISEMFQFRNFDLPMVQLMSGHKNPGVLLKVYTKLDPVKLVERLA